VQDGSDPHRSDPHTPTSIEPDHTLASRLREEIIAKTYFDELTGLGTRRLLERALAAVASEARSQKVRFAVLCLNVRGLSRINAVHGVSAGDAVLIAVGERLRACIGNGDLACRLGGDSFGLLLRTTQSDADLMKSLRRIGHAIEQPVTLATGQLEPAVMIGYAVFPEDGTEAERLLHNAELALYAARADATPRRRYRRELSDHAKNFTLLEKYLRTAIAYEYFEAWYQPIVRLDTGTLYGAEALVRLRDGTGNLLQPSVFVPVAEDTGLIGAIDRLIALAVRRDMSVCHEQGLPVPRISVNLSQQELGAIDVLDAFAELKATADDAGHKLPLTIEITETSLMHDIQTARFVIGGLSRLGFKIALDDFGTGSSSLSLLQTLPVDIVKIDRSFVAGLFKDKRSPQIVKAVIGLARAFEMSTVAEGIETEEQAQFLRDNGCELGQGYHFDRPLPVKLFRRRWLKPT